jgi:hypothetical protein
MTLARRLCKVTLYEQRHPKAERMTLTTGMFGAERMRSAGVLLLLALLALPAQAQDATEQSEPERLYQVELIVFRNLDQSGNTPEIPRLPEPELEKQLATDLARMSADDATEVTAEPPEWQATDPEGRLLAGTARSIRQLQAYELISYLSWGQAAPDVTVAAPLTLSELGVDPAILTGEVELHQRRYLHLEVDISLPGAGAAGQSVVLDPQNSPPPPAIRESRRVRLKELHYFDQPQFGIIAVVSRFPEATSEAG